MYELIKQLCENKGWEFGYGTQAYLNLLKDESQETVESLNGKTFAFLEPASSAPQLNAHGGIDSTRYVGTLMLLKSSIIDEPDYQTRFDKYIKPLIEEFTKDFISSLSCANSVKIESLRIVEVINMFDFNFDGILVDYQVLIDG